MSKSKKAQTVILQEKIRIALGLARSFTKILDEIGALMDAHGYTKPELERAKRLASVLHDALDDEA